jgi:CPA1 family monovalent cation:H+ antiporter
MKWSHLLLTTALLASGSYLVALFAHASAPIACVIGGLIVGNKWQEIREQREIREVNHFWHTVEGIINSFLFTLIGLELFILDLSANLIIGGIIAFFILHFSDLPQILQLLHYFPLLKIKAITVV